MKKNLKSKRLIILNAGDSFELDGFNKLLIKNPKTGKRIIDEYLEIFNNYQITIIVGYRAMDLMNKYPNIDYVYNKFWQTTNNSYSLSLALDYRSSIITSCDLIINNKIIDKIEKKDNSIFVNDTENKKNNSIFVEIKKKNQINKIYYGNCKKSTHKEFSGIIKVSDKEIIYNLKKNCQKNPNLFIAENLPLNLTKKFSCIKINNFAVKEFSSPQDYINLLHEK